MKGVSKTADACIEFRNCDFKTNIMLDGVRVSIKLKGKSLYLGKGSVFKNITCPNKIENIDKSSIPYSWFQSHGILIQEGLYPRLAYLKAVDELYFKEDK